MTHIAFAGRSNAGKSTLAALLESQYHFSRLSIADIVKDVCKALKDKPTRGDYQKVSDVMKRHWKDILSYTLLEKIRSAPSGVKIVVDDVRTNEELSMLKSLGFTTVLVTCDESERLARAAKRNGDDLQYLGHPIENEAFTPELIDHVYYNHNGTIDTPELAKTLGVV